MCEIEQREDIPDGDFTPNLLNTVIFILSSWMQLNTFASNYTGTLQEG